MYVMYKKDEGFNTGTIVAVSNDPEADKVWKDGIWVDELPQSTPSAGKFARLKINLETKELYYIYVDGAGNSTNDYLTRIKRIEDQLDQVKQAVDDIIMGGIL